jgi:spermidine/putrescine transport system substrate-binding protein
LCSCQPSASPPAATPEPLASELVFYDWEADVPASVLDQFQKEYGVKIRYEVYESQEEAIANIRAGGSYDVAVLESRFLPQMVRDRLLAELDYRNIPNRKNLAADFRDLVSDPGNRHNVPFNWGLTGLVVRTDLLKGPVTRWADLWDRRYRGKVGLWMGVHRDVIALTLKSLGFSANSEKPAELEAALKRLLELKGGAVALEDLDPDTSADALATGKVVVSMGYAKDCRVGREKNKAIAFVVPEEGALLWNDGLVILARSPKKRTAEVFVNYLLRPDISAKITTEKGYPTANEAALPLVDSSIRNDPVLYPPPEVLKTAEVILPLSPEGVRLYAQLWRRFEAGASP